MVRDGAHLDIDAAGIIGVFLFVPVIGDVMGHAPPLLAGWVVAVLAAPAVLIGDGLHKLVIARRRARSLMGVVPLYLD